MFRYCYSFDKDYKDSLQFGPDLSNLVKCLVDEVTASQAANSKAEKEIEWHKALILEAEKSKKNDLHDAASLRERVAVSITREK